MFNFENCFYAVILKIVHKCRAFARYKAFEANYDLFMLYTAVRKERMDLLKTFVHFYNRNNNYTKKT